MLEGSALAIAALLLTQVSTVPSGEQPVLAYQHDDRNAGAIPFHNQSMWHAFHGRAGVDRIVDNMIARLIVDRRVSDIFKNQDLVRLRRTLKEQFCFILTGGCQYSGRTMHDAHINMGIQDADLSALVEDLQSAMAAEHVPFHAQNRFLAKLAPMRRSVVKQVGPPVPDQGVP